MMNRQIVGVDIGGTKCAITRGPATESRAGEMGSIADKLQLETRAIEGPGQASRRIFEAIDTLLEKGRVPREALAGIGVSCGGPLDSRRGVIMNPPNLYGWDAVPITAMLQERFGAPAFLQNDANACALAEWKFGAAQGLRNVVFLTFGTGMGAGLILDGRLYSGTSDMAGEEGHIRLSALGPVGYGKSGSFEGFCSGGGIAQLARTRVLERLQVGERPVLCLNFAGLETLDARQVALVAGQGDELALSIYEECAEYLGRGIAILVDILNPEMIVLGSVFERNEGLFYPRLSQVLEREALVHSLACCRIVPAKLGDQLGDYAALSVALEGLATKQNEKENV